MLFKGDTQYDGGAPSVRRGDAGCHPRFRHVVFRYISGDGHVGRYVNWGV